MSWAPEVIADSSGQWCGNALRFATEAEALAWVADRRARWWLVTNTRVVQSDDPVNYRWVEGYDSPHGWIPGSVVPVEVAS